MTIIHQPFFIPAVLFAFLSTPLILGLIPPNRFYGFRTRRTLLDQGVWYASNLFGGWCFLASSLIYLLVAIFLPCTTAAGTDFSRWLLHLIAFVLPLLISILLVRRYILRL